MGVVNTRRWTAVNQVALMRYSLFAVVLLLLWLCVLTLSSDRISADASLLPWYIQWQNDRLGLASNLKWDRPPQPNPYTLPGIYHQDRVNLKENKWVPFHDAADSESPSVSSLLEILRQGPEEAGSEYGWFANRTLVLLSDSIGREHTEAFCMWFGGTFEAIPKTHPAYPARAIELEDKYAPGKEWDQSHRGRPWQCKVDAWNTSMIYAWIIMDDETAESVDEDIPWSIGGYWSDSTYWTPPTQPSDRVSSLIGPMLRNLGRDQVDLVEFSTSAWTLDAKKRVDHDAAYKRLKYEQYANETEASQAGSDAADTPLEIDYVTRWRDTTQALAGTIRDTFGPIPPILYRLLHQMEQHHEYPHRFVHSRTAALNAAVATIPQIEMNPWAEMIRGQEDIRDWIHPNLPPRRLWVEMTLMRLWQAVFEAQQGKLWPMPDTWNLPQGR